MMKMKVIGLALALVCSNASADIMVKYGTPNTPSEREALNEIKDSEMVELVTSLSKDLFPFKKTLNLHIGSEEEPSFDPNSNTIDIPYRFYTQSKSYFMSNQYQKDYGTSPTEASISTLLHTLLHEFGHAYIADKNIPILGKEEDAVDNFATIIMLEYVENGGDKAIAAADMFAFESESEDSSEYYELDEYIDEHSFNLQRYFSTLCLVYGSDPIKYKNLLTEIEPEYLKERQELCVEHYEQISSDWHRYLSE